MVQGVLLKCSQEKVGFVNNVESSLKNDFGKPVSVTNLQTCLRDRCGKRVLSRHLENFSLIPKEQWGKKTCLPERSGKTYVSEQYSAGERLLDLII